MAYEALNEVIEVREIREMRNHDPRVFRERLDPFDIYSDREFRTRYRLSKDCARFVIELVEDRLCSPSERGNDISSALQVLIALRFYAKGCYQTELGDLHGVSQSSVSRIVTRVSQVVAELLPRYIVYTPRVETLQNEFYNIARFPQVVGCIDCTHVPIKSPGNERAALYINRKGFYSLNVQVVCDAQRRILDIVAKWRGSVHDARIWTTCTLKNKFEAGRIRGVLLGDSGYPCKSYLLTPFLHPRTALEERYNEAHIRTRITVERCFGEWKGMFRALRNGLHISLPTAKIAIVAMAVLFNIRKEFGDTDVYDEESDEDDEVDEEEIDNGVAGLVQQGLGGNAFRQDFVRRHFT